MGKSPGKWIKTVLFGKKSSKSNPVKGREKTANEKGVLVTTRATEADATSFSPVVSHPIPTITDGAEGKLEQETKETSNLQHDDGILLAGSQDSLQGSTPKDAPSDPEKIRQEKAATIAQAAFRGYLARRAFKALKGIIRLQALIRGHLVRRQAVATLFCMLGIVRLQALARGKKIRNSDIGQEVHKIYSLVKPQDSNGVNISNRMAKMSANAFVCKLLASSPPAMPLRLYYVSEEPNSVSSWLERWSASSIWKPVPQPKKMPYSKTQRKQSNGHMVEPDTGRPKRSVRRVPAANVDNPSVQATSEFEKPKRNLRKVSTHPTDTSQENSQNELEKVKRNLRKVHSPVVENSVQPDVEIEKPKQSLEKISGTLGDNVLGQSTSNPGEKMKKETTLTTSKLADVVKSEPTVTMPKSPDAKTTREPLEVSKASEISPGDQPVVESKALLESGGKDENTPITNGELSHKEDATSNQNHKSGRKASILAKQERAENGLQSSPTLPSYMAATESAKAKLRVQGSPRLTQDGPEKNSATRRHSLPSSTNSKISAESPRTQRGVHGSGKGGNRSDRSLLSSRDGNAKGTQAEWRR